MARPKAPSPFDAHMNAARQRVFSQRPQPSGDISKVLQDSQTATKGTGLSVKERRSIMNRDAENHLANLHAHAQAVAGGPGPYPISGYTLASANANNLDAKISQTTLEDFLASWYGKHWPEVRERMIKAQGAPEWHYLRPDYNAGNFEKNLGRRIYEIEVGEPTAINAANMDAGVFQYSPSGNDVGDAGFHPQHIRHHEFSHLLFPPSDGKRMDNDLFPAYSQGDGGSLFEPGSQNYPHLDFSKFVGALSGNADQVIKAANHIRYTSKPAETLAALPHLMRLEYGLSGKPMRTEADRIRAVQKWVSEPTRYGGGAPGWHNAFGPDPVMQHGPEAGNPAHGYNFLRNTFKLLLPRIPKSDKKVFIDAMEGFGSTDPKEEAVYG